MEKGNIIKRKMKCHDGKVRTVDCMLISIFKTQSRQMNPDTLQPVGDWEDCFSCVVKWTDTNGILRTDNITLK
jgi:hypothetical protein